MFRLIVAVAAVVSVLALVGVASAGNVHFAGHPAEPAFNDLGTDLRATVDVAGLGNFSTQLKVAASGSATGTSTCTNNGGTAATGQNPAAFPVTSVGTVVVPGSDIKNGRVQLTATAITTPLAFDKAGAPDCANPNWTEHVTITNVAWTSATVAITQDTNKNGAFEEAAALSATCGFSTPTSDGAVPVANVSC